MEAVDLGPWLAFVVTSFIGVSVSGCFVVLSLVSGCRKCLRTLVVGKMDMKRSLEVSLQGNDGHEVVRKAGTAVSFCI